MKLKAPIWPKYDQEIVTKRDGKKMCMLKTYLDLPHAYILFSINIQLGGRNTLRRIKNDFKNIIDSYKEAFKGISPKRSLEILKELNYGEKDGNIPPVVIKQTFRTDFSNN